MLTPALNVSNVLGLVISLKVGPIFSILYPPTYALPGDTLTVKSDSDAVLPSSVVSPTEYTPLSSSNPDVVTFSFTSNWKGLTV